MVATGAARGRARRPGCIRTSGCGIRASSPSGCARYDPQRAAGELRALFRGQWANGMLPHMIFDDGVNDIGSRRIWQSKRNPLRPATSTRRASRSRRCRRSRPARVAQALPAPDEAALPGRDLPKLVAYHAMAVPRARPARLAARHAHPSVGMRARHDAAVDAGAGPRCGCRGGCASAARLHLARAVRSVRNDTRFIPAAERPSDDDGLRMLVLATRAKKHDFQLQPDAARRLRAHRGSGLQRDPRRREPLARSHRARTRSAVADRAAANASGEPTPRSSSCGTNRRGSTTRATRPPES